MRLKFWPMSSERTEDKRDWLAIGDQGNVTINFVTGIFRDLYKLANPRSKKLWQQWWGERE